jgi:DNA-binding transcriptional LysR family regulator
MINLNRLSTLVAVVEAGSFSKAAVILGQTKAMVSFNIKQLEAELGVALLTRTTRRLALTEVGEQFYRDCVKLLHDANSAVDQVRAGQSILTGTLRITATVEYGNRIVVPALAAFSAHHPQLKIDYVSSSLHEDLIAERFDIAIRLGQLVNSSLRARQIQSFRILPVASPQYLQQHQIPQSPEALEKVQWLGHSRLDGTRLWQLQGDDGRTLTLPINSQIQADTASALHGFALAGCGVAILPDWAVQDDLAAGRLEIVFPGYRLPTQGVYAVYPDTAHLAAKVRLFIDFLKQRVASSSHSL